MSLLIKGMKMPKHCWQCKFKDRDLCVLLDDDCLKIWGELIRLPNCPLIELLDHGDLIDRDVVENAALMIWLRNSNGNDAMEQTIEHIRHNIKAVIPAERSEE